MTIAKTPSVSVSMRDLLILSPTSRDNLLRSPVIDSGLLNLKCFDLYDYLSKTVRNSIRPAVFAGILKVEF